MPTRINLAPIQRGVGKKGGHWWRRGTGKKQYGEILDASQTTKLSSTPSWMKLPWDSGGSKKSAAKPAAKAEAKFGLGPASPSGRQLVVPKNKTAKEKMAAAAENQKKRAEAALPKSVGPQPPSNPKGFARPLAKPADLRGIGGSFRELGKAISVLRDKLVEKHGPVRGMEVLKGAAAAGTDKHGLLADKMSGAGSRGGVAGGKTASGKTIYAPHGGIVAEIKREGRIVSDVAKAPLRHMLERHMVSHARFTPGEHKEAAAHYETLRRQAVSRGYEADGRVYQTLSNEHAAAAKGQKAIPSPQEARAKDYGRGDAIDHVQGLKGWTGNDHRRAAAHFNTMMQYQLEKNGMLSKGSVGEMYRLLREAHYVRALDMA